MVTLDDVKNVLIGLPSDVLLTQYGNELGNGSLIRKTNVDKADIEANAQLFDLKRIQKSVLEIPNIFSRSRTRHKFSSYALKHVLEEQTGEYITNGDFIVAMILSGFAFKFGNSVNPVFNVKFTLPSGKFSSIA